MLSIARRMSELSFEQLMEVYREGNEENGRILAPLDSRERQLRLAEEDFRAYLLESFFPVSGAMYTMWSVDGKYVSALRLEPYRDGLLLEALETAPGQRGRGYAASLIRSVQELLAGGGSFRLYSHVSRKNLPSLKTHRRCGFQVISDFAEYLDGTVDACAYTMRYDHAGE